MTSAGDVFYEQEVLGTSLTYPDDAPPLHEGETYSWKVTQTSLTKLPDPASFDLQSAEERGRLLAELRTTTGALNRAQIMLRYRVWYDALDTLLTESPSAPDHRLTVQQIQALYSQVSPGCADIK